MARDVQHLDGEVADRQHLAVLEQAVGPGRVQRDVPGVAPDRESRRGAEVGPGPDVVPVAVRLDDGHGPQVGEHRPDRRGVVGRVDHQRGPRPGVGEDVDVVVHLGDRALPDQERSVPPLEERSARDDVVRRVRPRPHRPLREPWARPAPGPVPAERRLAPRRGSAGGTSVRSGTAAGVRG